MVAAKKNTTNPTIIPAGRNIKLTLPLIIGEYLLDGFINSEKEVKTKIIKIYIKAPREEAMSVLAMQRPMAMSASIPSLVL